MPFKSIKKYCLQCDKRLVLSSKRDLERKKFCSHACRQRHRWATSPWAAPTKPKGIRHVWGKQLSCELCLEKVVNGHPRQRWCKECVPDHKWRARAMRYGIGKKQWDKMLVEQGGACALCPAEPEVVDHNHATGITRGLLCQVCNLRLHVVEDKDWLKRAKLYARR